MIIQGLEFPDNCPQDCPHKNEILDYGQSAVCCYCPVFACQTLPSDPSDNNSEPRRMVEPDDFRRDWLEEWYEFFKTGKQPILEFEVHKKNKKKKGCPGCGYMFKGSYCPRCGGE